MVANDKSHLTVKLELPSPYLVFLGDLTQATNAKTAFGLRDWARERCMGEFALPTSTISTGLPRLSMDQARAQGAKSLIIGAAAPGGAIAASWVPALVEALDAGLDIISGMHTPLADNADIRAAAARSNRQLIEVRRPPKNIPIGNGRKRSGLRLLTVGTDCALGKKYTALTLNRAFRARGLNSDFRATGQTGIMIVGEGIPMDAVVADFSAGAAEALSPDNAPDHWDVIEGQGSLFHPAYAGVSLGLLHGSQPDVIVLCHEPGRREMAATNGYKLPGLKETIDTNLLLGARTNPKIRCAGVSLNTSALSVEAAEETFATIERELGLPAADPIRGGQAFDRLVESCLA